MLKKRQSEVKRSIFLFDEVKKHSRTSPELQSKELNEIQAQFTWPADQLNNPSQKVEISKVEKQKESH